jgi:hypothetical protein
MSKPVFLVELKRVNLVKKNRIDATKASLLRVVRRILSGQFLNSPHSGLASTIFLFALWMELLL